MFELFHESIRPVNLPYTILFGLSAFYWIFYLLGAVGSDLLDFDFDADIEGDGMGDMDVDADVDADLDGAGESSGTILGALMRFVYAADVPVTVIFSVLSAAMWVYSLLANRYLGAMSDILVVALFVPIFIGGVVTTKVVLMPFVPILKKAFDETSDSIEVLGKLCVVCSLEASDRHGQVELPLKGSPLLLNVKTREGVVLKKGDEAVVVGKDDDGTYIVAPFEGDANKLSVD